MSYYILGPACDTPETGHVYPQVQKLKPGYDENKPDSIYSYLKQSRSANGFPNWAPELDNFVMHGHAKPTDLVSNSAGSGFFISQKLKSIIEKYNLIPHRFYPAKIIHRKKLLEGYFWAHMMADFTNLVDYSNSTFFIYKHYRLDDGDIKVASLDDYFEKKKKLIQDNPGINITIWIKTICLYPSFFNQKLDLFKIGLYDTNYYISQELRDDLVENKITGCDIQLTNRIIM